MTYRIDFTMVDIGDGRYATGWLIYENKLDWYGDIYDCDFKVNNKVATEDDAIDLVEVLIGNMEQNNIYNLMENE